MSTSGHYVINIERLQGLAPIQPETVKKEWQAGTFKNLQNNILVLPTTIYDSKVAKRHTLEKLRQCQLNANVL